MRITEGKTTRCGSHIDRSGSAFNIWVSSSGWAEGECKGKAGWFPFNYVERRERLRPRLNSGDDFFVEAFCQDGRIYFTIALRHFGDDFSVFFICFEC
ncbi:uncharacterized protein LOC112094376 isoform X2 [Morus notabilis]|uniref:uncharacterized protein LOC112094376 isoform X2 n=1 Tax=Morus notabilis TaxID=981085 RepID=UPI000CED6373|nr:uncharacterized protein LOC112094376 isoform X2 [Morus notabilis]